MSNDTPLDVFKKFTEAVEWPELIAHLKGRVIVRNKDGLRFRISRPEGQCIGRKPAAYLAPIDWNWPKTTRSHWKTHEKILKEMHAE